MKLICSLSYHFSLGRDSPLLSSTLAGLSTFAHLINLDFFDDLLSNLHSIIATHRGLTFENSLHCVHTTFTILSGQGSALNIDPMRFYGQLYKDLLLEMTRVLGDKTVTAPLFLKCIHKMLVARSKQVRFVCLSVCLSVSNFVPVCLSSRLSFRFGACFCRGQRDQ